MIGVTCLNSLERAPFASALNEVFEHSPWVAERAWERRPFQDLHCLHEALVKVVQGASDGEKLQLIRAHPDLVGAAARAGTLTEDSSAEQAGIDALTPEDVARFEDYNARYRKQFGFPFVICVRDHKKSAIFADFERRLRHDPVTERQNALSQIGQIAWHRLQGRVNH
jgi:2-oxo-4-hydroxy-4-carboxy-5-ureidoimidazoline decarboxylase